MRSRRDKQGGLTPTPIPEGEGIWDPNSFKKDAKSD